MIIASTAESVLADNPPKRAPATENPDAVPDLTGTWRIGNGKNEFQYCQVRFIGADYLFAVSESSSMMYVLRWEPQSRAFRVDLPDEKGETIPHRLSYTAKDDTITLSPIMDEKVTKKLAENVDLPDESPVALERHFKQVLTRYVSDRVQGGEFLIVERKDGLDAYSEVTGTWDRMPVSLPKNGFPRLLKLTAGKQFAAVVIDDQVLGYSSQAGHWGKLKIPTEYVNKVFPLISQNLLTVQIGDKYYALSPKSGQWTSPDAKQVNRAVEEASDREVVGPGLNRTSSDQIKVFTLVNADATGLTNTLLKIYPGEKISADGRTNTLIIASPNPNRLAEIEAILRELDEIPSRRNSGAGPDAKRPPTARPNNFSSGETQQLAARIQQHENTANEIAQKLRTACATCHGSGEFRGQGDPGMWKRLDKSPHRSDHRGPLDLRKQLENELTQALSLKFQSEELQVKDLQNRLSNFQRQIGERKALREKITERRLQELLDQDETRWEIQATEKSQESKVKQSEDILGMSRLGIQPHMQQPVSRDPVRSEVFPRRPVKGMVELVNANDPIAPDSTQIKVTQSGFLQTERIDVRYERGTMFTGTLNFHREQVSSVIRFDYCQFVNGIGTGSVDVGELEVYPAQPETIKYLESHSLSLDISRVDLAHAVSGKPVTKVIYVSSEALKKTDSEKAEILVSNPGQSSEITVREAQSRGIVLAVLRVAVDPEISNIPKSLSEPAQAPE